MGFFSPEYWGGLPFPSLGHLPNPGIEPGSSALQVDSLPTELRGKPCDLYNIVHEISGSEHYTRLLRPLGTHFLSLIDRLDGQ